MYKSLIVHYKNKFPGSKVMANDNGLDVFFGDSHLVCLRKNGAGQLVDASEEMGCADKHCLAPIPKDARVHKLFKDGKIGLDEKAAERSEKREVFACPSSDHAKILSCEDLKEHGYVFHDDGSVKEAPKA